MKLTPALTRPRIEALKKGIPKIDEMEEIIEKSLSLGLTLMREACLNQMSKLDCELGNLTEKFKQVMGDNGWEDPTQPTSRRIENGKEQAGGNN